MRAGEKTLDVLTSPPAAAIIGFMAINYLSGVAIPGTSSELPRGQSNVSDLWGLAGAPGLLLGRWITPSERDSGETATLLSGSDASALKIALGAWLVAQVVDLSKLSGLLASVGAIGSKLL